LRLALLVPLRFCRLAFWPWDALRLRADWPRCVVLVVDSVPSAARRGAASAGTVLVATIRPPRAARNKTFFIMGSTFLSESEVSVARIAQEPPMQFTAHR
jgi:hypothetical protein